MNELDRMNMGNYIIYDPDLGPDQEYCQYVRAVLNLGYISLNSENVSFEKENNIIKIRYGQFDLDENTHVKFGCVESYDNRTYYVYIN